MYRTDIALASADEDPNDLIKSLPYISSLPPQGPKSTETAENAASSQPTPSTDLEDIEQTGQVSLTAVLSRELSEISVR